MVFNVPSDMYTFQFRLKTLRKKCANTEFFLVRIEENTDQKKTLYLATFHAVRFSFKAP